ncbi:MAG: hypothetical protein IJ383_02565 [Bacteroidales bacterium]|nr:hypothetical protein [Bacteroidales bacterium]
MAGFFKNRARKKLLEQVWKDRRREDGQQCGPVFPDVKGSMCVGILFSAGTEEDLRRLEELAGWAAVKAGGIKEAGDKDAAGEAAHGSGCAEELQQIKFSILAVETARCFKNDRLRESFVERLRGGSGGTDIIFVGKEDISAVGVPRKGESGDFLSRNFDMLVVIGGNGGDFTLEYLAGKASAAFVVGIEPREAGYYDMVLAPAGRIASPVEYLQQLFAYLANMSLKQE